MNELLRKINMPDKYDLNKIFLEIEEDERQIQTENKELSQKDIKNLLQNRQIKHKHTND